MLEILSATQLVTGFMIILAAFIVRGITGFGSGLIAIPLIVLMVPINIAVPMVGLLDYTAALGHGVKLRNDIRWRQILPLLPFSLIGVLLALVKLRNDIRWRQILPLLPFSLIGVLLALYLFNTVDAELLKKFLGGFIVLYALYTLLSVKAHTHKSLFWAVPSGIFGGLIGTLFGTGGPFYVIYLQLQGLGKAAFRATIATVFFLDGTARIAAYTFNGFYTLEVMILIGISLPVMIIGMYIGGHIHTNFTHQTIQKAIAVLLLFSGSALLFSD